MADDKKVAAIAGHQVQSVVQHTKYGNRFDTLDVVDMINEGSLKDVQTKNKYIEGILSVSKIYKRLSGEEYYEYIGRHLTEEQKLLNEYRKRLKEEYGSVDNAVENQKELEGLSEVYKKFKNKQDMLRRKAMKAVSESRRVEALKKMTIAEEEGQYYPSSALFIHVCNPRFCVKTKTKKLKLLILVPIMSKLLLQSNLLEMIDCVLFFHLENRTRRF